MFLGMAGGNRAGFDRRGGFVFARLRKREDPTKTALQGAAQTLPQGILDGMKCRRTERKKMESSSGLPNEIRSERGFRQRMNRAEQA
jgi:hypothetical protein